MLPSYEDCEAVEEDCVRCSSSFDTGGAVGVIIGVTVDVMIGAVGITVGTSFNSLIRAVLTLNVVACEGVSS